MSNNELAHKSEIDHLKELILKSGFPLEIEIASYLAERSTLMSDWGIETSAHYLDKDKGIGRELDIKMKIDVSPKKKGSPMIFLNLLIECKSILGNAWVFFKSPHKLEPKYESTSILDVLDWAPKEHVDFIRLDGLHFRKLPMTNIYNEFILNRKQSNKRGNLFEAITELAKATNYEVETFASQTRKELDGFTMQDWRENARYLDYVEIFYPVIVFDGKMYTVEEVQKGKNMTLNPADHVGLLHNYISGNYNVELAIDVVHRKAFERFIKTIIEDIEIWKKALAGDVGAKFRKEVAKAAKWYSSKRKR
jgi:hypothetical protein